MLTIFTPTFNRKHFLLKLYQSLLAQTCQDFTWLLIDDGSTDGTDLLVQSWITENQINIRYIYQQNGGKMRAHNHAVELCETEFFLCIDSDDSLVEDAVEVILKTWGQAGVDGNRFPGRNIQEPADQIEGPGAENATLTAKTEEAEDINRKPITENRNLTDPKRKPKDPKRKPTDPKRKSEEQLRKGDLAGLVAYKGKSPTETMHGEHFPPGLTTSTLSNLYRKGFQGETTLVFRTEILRQHPFPEFPGEKFIPEAVLYDQIDQDHELLLIPKVLTLCEYHPDGLTAGVRRIRRENPRGWLYYYQQRISREPWGILRYKYLVHAVCFAWQVHESVFGCISAGKFEILTAVPAAVLFRLVGRL